MPKKWNPDAKPAEKLLALYTTLLFSGREISLSELSRLLECSKQSVGRLIAQLEAASYGKVIRLQSGREALYKLERPKNLPHLALDAEGLYQLALCRDFILNLMPESMKQRIGKTLHMASAFLPAGERAPVEIGRGLSKGAIDYTPYQEQLEALMRAIREARICTVTYRADGSGPAKTYDFAPKLLLAYHETNRVNGWIVDDQKKPMAKYDDPATLLLHRISQVALSGKSGAHLPDPEEAPSGVFGVIRDQVFTATIRFSPNAADYVSDRKWSDEQSLSRQEDGSIVLSMQSGSYLELLAWALSFGSQAEILSPDWLRDEIAGEVEKLSKVYGR
jgi:predicted DNA-binding transcriptional regulator YafY